MRDQFDNLVTTDTSTVTIAIGTNPAGGVLGGTTSVAAVGGVATFSNLSINQSGNGYTLSVTDGALTGATSSAFNITAAAAHHLAIGTQPTNTVAGVAIAPSITVFIVDTLGNVVTTDNSNVTLAIDNNAGGGTLSGSATIAAVNGVATFSTLSIDKAGTGYTLRATDGSLVFANTNGFNITPAASKLAFVAQPTLAGQIIAPPVQAQVQDAFGNLVTSDTSIVTIAFGTNPAGGVLTGTLSVAAIGGVATFSDLSSTKAAIGYTLAATDGTLTAATSNAFNIVAAAADHLAFSQQPTNSNAGQAIAPPVAVRVLDVFNNVVLTDSSNVTVAIGRQSGQRRSQRRHDGRRSQRRGHVQQSFHQSHGHRLHVDGGGRFFDRRNVELV